MGFSRHQLSTLSDILRATSAAEIMPRFRNLGPAAIRSKASPLDLVTDADEAAEAAITAALAHAFPGALVVGEEATARDPSRLDGLAEAPLAFVVDPVDGTANYAAGLPLFGCMAAALMHGEVVASAIHDPVGGDTALALRGEGAWLERADGGCETLRVAAPVPPGAMSGAASWRYLPAGERAAVCRNLARVAASWDLRCAAHQYRMLAAGSCHFLLFNRLLPWDHAPGWLLHREAGGYSAGLDGSPYRPALRGRGLLCAPDEASWLALRAALFES